MRLRFQEQDFQREAADAACRVFEGQPRREPSWVASGQDALGSGYTSWGNAPLELGDAEILMNIQKVQAGNGLKPDAELIRFTTAGPWPPAALPGKKKARGAPGQLICPVNLAFDMETGVGKTYTYIKTIYELNKAYAWKKFIIVAPRVSIREGIYKTFQITEDHFRQRYGCAIRYFIYDSGNLARIKEFCNENAIYAMIITTAAFGARDEKSRRIKKELDATGSRRPLDMLADTHPIMIIDEPQTGLGAATRESMAMFKPMLSLRYSATHKPGELYNLLYRLDAQDALNKKLVKKVSVVGVAVSGQTGADAYVCVERVSLSAGEPVAVCGFDCRTRTGISRRSRSIKRGDNLYELSGGLESYKNGYQVADIRGDGVPVVEFANGLRVYAGSAAGDIHEPQLRRLQIRETLRAHFQREAANRALHVKTLSLFFIDRVAGYRDYGPDGVDRGGEYARMFEQEYVEIVKELREDGGLGADYLDWLERTDPAAAHAGYFAIDKKTGRMADVRLKARETVSDSKDDYELIMRDRERLLSLDEPVRFIFSCEALREGWDNPNIFQICALKHGGGSQTARRQEVGRGMRLCVDKDGERMDAGRLGAADVHDVNCLTVITGESYEEYKRHYERELAEAVTTRPREVGPDFFIGADIALADGGKRTIDKRIANILHHSLWNGGYIDASDHLLPKYHEDKQRGALVWSAEAMPYAAAAEDLLERVYNPPVPGNQREKREARLDAERLKTAEFKELWERISRKACYAVRFDEKQLIEKCVKDLDENLAVQAVKIVVKKGALSRIESKESLERGQGFLLEQSSAYEAEAASGAGVKYDLLGRLVERTGLARATIARILQGVKPETFALFRKNPEDFIIKAGNRLNDQKAEIVIEHIEYNVVNGCWDSAEIFTPLQAFGPGQDVVPVKKHIYDLVKRDSLVERQMVDWLEAPGNKVDFYIKLPPKFFIRTPVGNYNPDWAVAFQEAGQRHVYFVAETKGSLSSLELKGREKAKISCARRHFEALNEALAGKAPVRYGVATNPDELLDLLRSKGAQGGHDERE